MFYPLLGIDLAMIQNSNLEVFGQYNIVSKPFFIGPLLSKNVPKDLKLPVNLMNLSAMQKFRLQKTALVKFSKYIPTK